MKWDVYRIIGHRVETVTWDVYRIIGHGVEWLGNVTAANEAEALEAARYLFGVESDLQVQQVEER